MAQQWFRPKILGLCIARILLTFWKLEFSLNEHGVAHKSQSEPVDHPNSCGLVRFTCHMATQTEVVQKLTAVPCLLLLPSTQLPLRTLRCSRPGLLQSWTTLSRIGHSTTQHLPLWIFSWSGIQHSLASPNTSTLLSNWVLGCLQVIRWYLIVCRATLVRAVSSCVSGEAIFRIQLFY